MKAPGYNSPEQIVELFREDGEVITYEQAEQVLGFLK